MDEQGFTEWAVGRQRQLLRSAYLLTGDLHRAEDLVQEALTKVALRWSRLAEGNPTAYALRIIARDNISWWRRRRTCRPTPCTTAARATSRRSLWSYAVRWRGSPRRSGPWWCCATSTT